MTVGLGRISIRLLVCRRLGRWSDDAVGFGGFVGLGCRQLTLDGVKVFGLLTKW